MQEPNQPAIQEKPDQFHLPERRVWITPDFVRIGLDSARHHANACIKNDGFTFSDC